MEIHITNSCSQWKGTVEQNGTDGVKKARSLLRLATMMLVTVFLSSCTPWLDEFLTAATDRATQEDVLQQIGQPTQRKPIEGGGEIWSYRMAHASYAGGAGKSNCFQYLLTFDKQKVLRQWETKGC